MAQSVDAEIPVSIGLKDLKEVDRRLQDYDISKEIEKAKDDRITNLEKDLATTQKELDLEKRTNEVNQKIIDLQNRQIELDKQNFDQMKDIADRAIKLGEIGKPSPVKQIVEWVVRIAAFAAGFLIHR